MVQTTSHIFSGKVDIESNLLVGSSHLFVDTTNNRVGITTADPDASLHVNGNAYVESNVGVGSNIELDGDTGIITATEFRGDGSNLAGVLTSLQNATEQGSTSDATIQLTNPDTSLVASGNVVISGNVTSLTFIGDGSQLTGVATNLQAITDNGNVTSNTVQFTNTGTSLTASGTIKAVAVQVNGLDVALDRDMTSNAGRINVLETDLTSNVTRVTNLEAANVVQETLITNLRTELDSNAVRVSSLETDRTSNTLRISLLESSNIVQGDLLTDLRTDVTSNTGRIADLESANGVQETLITNLRTDLDSNVVRISSLETDRTSNTSRISVLESANTVQGDLLTDLRTDVTSNTSRISSLETDFTDNVTRIGTLETANVVQGSLISSLQSANTVQGTLISNLETVTQYISATASGTVITSNLDVTGNIFMRGDRFVVESETKLINDAIIGIANNNTTSTTDVGIIMQRPTANVALIHHGGTNDFTIGYTQNNLEATDITNDTTNEINVNVLGNLYTQNNLTVGNVVTASAFVGDGTGITGINLQQVAAVGHTTTTPLITSNTLTGKRTGAFDSKGDSTIEGEVFIDNLNAGEMTSQSISGTQKGTGSAPPSSITITNPIVITYDISNWLVNGQSWNDEFHFTFIEGLTYVFDISHVGTRVQTTGPHIGYFDITGDYNYTFNSTPYEFGVKRVGEQGYSGAQFRWTVPRGASSFQGGGGSSHPGPGYFYFMTKPITTGSTYPQDTTERRIHVIPNPDQHLLTGQTQIHGNLYSDSTIVSTNIEATDTVTASDLVSSTRALMSNVATIGTTKTFVVTVSNASGANKYYIDGELQDTIELHQNHTYIFDLSSSTLLTHPFVFQTTDTNDGTTNGTNYDTGITNTGTYGSDQKRTFVVPAGAPTTLYYYCTAHSGMGATISISPTAELIVSGRVVTSGNVDVMSNINVVGNVYANTFIGDGSQLTGISGATSSDLQVVTTNGAITTQAIQFTNTGTSLTASGGITAAYFTGDGSNVNIGEMTAETVPYVDSNKQLRDSHITRTADKTIITSNLEVTGNIFMRGNSYAITSNNTVINDRIIGLANNNTSTTLDVGLMLQYPQKNVAMIHHGTTSGSPHNGQLTLGYTQSGFEVDNITKDPSNNLTLNVWGHVITQNNITVGAQGSYYGDGTTLTGVALSADLTNNVTRISALETATIISNSSTITTGFTKGDIIYASADNVLNKLAIGGTDGYVLKVTSAANKTLGWAAESGGGGSGNTPWQTNGNKIHYPTDNVGINVSDPAFKLDVHGTANVGALTATSLSVGGQTLALASDLTANATRVDALYTAAAGDIIYATATNTLAKLSIGSANQVLTVQGGLPAWVNATGGGGGGGSSQWSNVTLDEVYFDGNVGIANTDPGHDLSVGSNLFVDDDGSNVLVVTGNTAMSSLTLGEVSIVASYGLNDILNVSNTSSNIMQLTNATTGLVATGNVHALKFIGSGSELTDIASNLDQIVNNGNVTSNTVQFSNATTGLVTTANVEVGGELTVSGNATVSENLTVSGNVSDLNVVSNVNMLHTANTAAIKLNSNVVAEFPRSKKLIKYPRVAMTSDNQPTGYVASASTSHSSGSYSAYKAFDSKYEFTTSSGWASDASAFNNQVPSVSASLFNNDSGEYLTIQLPNKIKLETHHLFGRQDIRTNEFPVSAKLYASNDNFTNFELIESYEDLAQPTSSTEAQVHNINETRYFQYYRLMITKTSGTQTYAAVGEWELYGVPEYDPEAHGTDVTVKSYPNVPNTDFLDVFVDAGNASGFTLSGSDVTGVTDLSTPANTMTVNGNVTYNSANKAFVFPGTGSSYMRATLVDGNGNYPLTLSVWFMITDYSGNWRSIITLGTNTTGEQASIAYDPNQDQLYFGTYGADIYVPHTPELGKWYHVAATFTGGSTTSSTMNVYLNGVNMGGVPDGTQTPSFTNNQLVIGGGMNSNGTVVNNPFKGQIGNARFYRRAYSSDEIYQLYAYQKEDFGHGDLSMTLKAGRLGIGTSEPRAALDVRGTAKVHGRPNFTESLFFYTGNTPTNYYVSTYKNRHGFYLNTLIPPDNHIGNYGTGGDNQPFSESGYGSSNELCKSHFDCMVYWLKNAPVGHVHRLNWCSKNGSGGSQTYGQKTSGTQIRLWGYWFHTGTYDRDWTSGVYFNISTSTVSVFYEGATFQ